MNLFIFIFFAAFIYAEDRLPSWNEGDAKKAIFNFISQTTDPNNQNYIKPSERIAVFDQDGTLWVEHPLYIQAIFALDRIAKLAPSHPEWKTKEPFKSVVEGKFNFDEKGWAEVIAATHTGMTTVEFTEIVKNWIETAKHPRFNKKYTELVYKPMLEVIELFQINGFQTYIVTGGGQEFVRVYSKSVYNIPVEQVIGSSVQLNYEYKDGKPVLVRLPKVFLIDDHKGKPIGIEKFIAKQPIAAFGNSDGDKEMLEWTQNGRGLKLMMLVHHDDPEREYAYGPNTSVGNFSDSLMDEAKAKGWIVISIRKDWKTIFK